MIILFGSSGYIGKEFVRQLNKLKIPMICWSNTKETTFNSLESWYKNVANNSIEYIINAAGVTGKPNVDACETNKEETFYGNVIWPQILTDWCILRNIPLLHISSGCIYQGRKENGMGFNETDTPNFTFSQNNCSFYSGTKALAEKVVSQWEKHYICRLRIPFEEYNNSRNYLTKLLTYEKLLIAENSISNKQEFVSICIQLLINKKPYGKYNIVNSGTVTTEKIVEKLKIIDKNKIYKLVDEKEFYLKYAKTPRSNCILDNNKLLSTGISIRSVDDALDYCINNWKFYEY
jgi:dTDP-4-dehydrorhamnose reductase